MSSALRDSVLTDPLTRKQPWRTLYLMYQVITTIFLRLPLWVIYYALPSNRPKSTWTLKRAVMIRAVKLLMHVAYMYVPTSELLQFGVQEAVLIPISLGLHRLDTLQATSQSRMDLM